jgi:P27 family predicted phage terminase small subunit
MGKRGAKPKPTALRLLEGNPGRLPINDAEPQCGIPPVMPATVAVDAIASEAWNRLREVCPPQLYNAMDEQTLTQHCLAWSMFLRSQQEIDEGGLFIETPHYDKEGNHLYTEKDVSPALKTWKSASEVLLKTTDRLGLSPTARTRIQIPKTVDVQSKFKGLIGRGVQNAS